MSKQNLTPIYKDLMLVRNKDATIRRKETQMMELKACLVSRVSLTGGDRVKASPVNRLEDIEGRIDELSRDVDLLRADKADYIIEVSDLIDRLEDEIEKAILTDFFIGKLSMRDIADSLGYTVQHAYRIRRRGLMKLQKMKGQANGNC